MINERGTKISNDEIIDAAEYYLKVKPATIRSTAKLFKVSKSALYKYFTYNLKYINLNLYKRVKKKLVANRLDATRRAIEARIKNTKLKKRIK